MAKEQSETTKLSKDQLQEQELVVNYVGRDEDGNVREPFGAGKLSEDAPVKIDDMILFYNRQDGFVTYAYSVEGKIFVQTMILSNVQVTNVNTPADKLEEMKLKATTKKIIDKLNGKPVKETYEITED